MKIFFGKSNRLKIHFSENQFNRLIFFVLEIGCLGNGFFSWEHFFREKFFPAEILALRSSESSEHRQPAYTGFRHDRDERSNYFFSSGRSGNGGFFFFFWIFAVTCLSNTAVSEKHPSCRSGRFDTHVYLRTNRFEVVRISSSQTLTCACIKI